MILHVRRTNKYSPYFIYELLSNFTSAICFLTNTCWHTCSFCGQDHKTDDATTPVGAGEDQNQLYLRAGPDINYCLTANEDLPKLVIISVHKISCDMSQLKIRHLSQSGHNIICLSIKNIEYIFD